MTVSLPMPFEKTRKTRSNGVVPAPPIAQRPSVFDPISHWLAKYQFACGGLGVNGEVSELKFETLTQHAKLKLFAGLRMAAFPQSI